MKTWNQKVGTLGAFVSVVALGLSVTQAIQGRKEATRALKKGYSS